MIPPGRPGRPELTQGIAAASPGNRVFGPSPVMETASSARGRGLLMGSCGILPTLGKLSEGDRAGQYRRQPLDGPWPALPRGTRGGGREGYLPSGVVAGDGAGPLLSL